MSLGKAVLVLCLAFAPACSQPPAEGIVFEVSTNLTLTEMDSFRVLITDASGKVALDRACRLVPTSIGEGGGVSLPFRLALFPDPSGPRPVRVDVTGWLGTKSQVWQKATFPFAPAAVRLPLLRDC